MKIGWVDFSRADREKILNVMHMLQEQGVLDEIGIGPLRDAFANYFFPGTSTIHTRAKYFIIVPYILQEAVSGKYGDQVSTILQKIDAEEKQCGISLYQRCIKDGGRPVGSGIIGARVLPGKWVSRTPVNIYWNGIRTYHIFEQDNLTIPDMIRLSVRLRAQDNSGKLGNPKDKTKEGAEEGSSDDKDAGRNAKIRFFDLPEEADRDWRDNLSIDLNKEEAVFLRDKIEKSVPDSLLAFILKHNIDLSKYDRIESLYADLRDELPPEMASKMKLAGDFNRLVYTARVRYNMILSRGENPDAVKEWAQIEDQMGWYISADLDDVFNMLERPNPGLRPFLFSLKNALENRDLKRADQILIDREIKIKTKPRARLWHPHDFDPNKWVGGGYLDYRFSNAKRIINDIYEGEGAIHVQNGQ